MAMTKEILVRKTKAAASPAKGSKRKAAPSAKQGRGSAFWAETRQRLFEKIIQSKDPTLLFKLALHYLETGRPIPDIVIQIVAEGPRSARELARHLAAHQRPVPEILRLGATGGLQGATEPGTLPSPEEYLRMNPVPGGLLYYPGSYTDTGPMKLFYEFGEVNRFLHADYLAMKGEALGTTQWLWEKYERKVTDLGLETFGAGSWEDFWDPQIRERRRDNIQKSHGVRQEVRTGPAGEQVDFIFLHVDAIGAWKHLVRAGYKPDVVVLQDHGFGGNWGHFGGEREFYRAVQQAGHWPEYLLVADNTRPWPGYRAMSSSGHQAGQMHGHHRAIYRRDGSEKSSYNPRKVGR